jgi:hypothetical protein
VVRLQPEIRTGAQIGFTGKVVGLGVSIAAFLNSAGMVCAISAHKFSTVLPRIIGQEFAGHFNLYPVAFFIGDFCDGHVKINGGHDPCAEFFFDKRFECWTINPYYFIEPVDAGGCRN